MPQGLLPLIPDGASAISDRVSVVRSDNKWTYLVGLVPVFEHSEEDHRSFRVITSQLVCGDTCTQAQIVRTFGVSPNSVKRSVATLREHGIAGFYRPRRGRGATVLTPEVLARAQRLLNLDLPRADVAVELGIHYDTLRKAISQGRLSEPIRAEDTGELEADESPDQRPTASPPAAAPHRCTPLVVTDKSTRAEADAAAFMGVACTRPVDRIAVAFRVLPCAPTRFEACRDLSFGGVLCALPALTANGLFDGLGECFPTLGGYYNAAHVLTLLGQMALCRIRTVEQLQYHSPGEMGKLMGLDRVPEVRCLRKKLAQLSIDDAPEKWAAMLSRKWMEDHPGLAGTLYVDGHVRLYHGRQTQLPRRYVSRQRLCLRGITDYWVNDAIGQPFFAVERTIDQGIIEVLQSDIVPRLLQDVPGQPTDEQLEADKYQCRFMLVFDRAAYSPEFFKEMWQKHRIACICYHKHPKEQWPKQWFKPTQVPMPNGETLCIDLAEMGSWVGDRRKGLWMREIRKLTAGDHQTSLISTAYGELGPSDAARLFSRWAQENFFRYMMEHYAIDLLSDYKTEEIPGTNRPVINPSWRELDRERRSLKGKLQQRQVRFAALTTHPETDEEKMPEWEKRKAELLEEIQQLEDKLDALKKRSADIPKHLDWEKLPDSEKFRRLAPSRKRLMDTVKMVAYRAETAMVAIVREVMARPDDARALVRDLFRTEADIEPDEPANVLHVRVHTMSNPRSNRAVAHLFEQLNAAEITYPGTCLRLSYSLAAPPPPQCPPPEDWGHVNIRGGQEF